MSSPNRRGAHLGAVRAGDRVDCKKGLWVCDLWLRIEADGQGCADAEFTRGIGAKS